jgi:hypothetical protein
MAVINNLPDSILGYKLRVLYPELVKELEKKPRLSDISAIPELIKTYYDPADRLVFLAVILNLYDPDVLAGWKRNLCRGIRSQLAELFDVSPTAISNTVGTAQNYMLIYKNFKDKVERLSNEIAEIYCKN